ncbi:biliverdin-producing heme oxygenase [Falsiroseomonas sp. CW058]|uniref:biliverdin-producing heme oxygenase n=1 Tax=Falsiroseomonas sp. CW058 TaxID=3388664 RepID=UPI003D324279
MPDGTARWALRRATDAAHERLHGMAGFRDLAEGRITRAGYAALLRRLLGFHAPFEARLAEVPGLDALIDLGPRRRAALIRHDLAALGEPAGEERAAVLPPLGSAARALGCLYVTEGSTLGGQQLARALDGLLPPGEEGRRFLLGHGARHGAMWRDCCAAIEACGADPARRAEMVDGAVATFEAFEAWCG